MIQQWKEEATRLGGPALVQVLVELRDGQLEMMANFDVLNRKVAEMEASTKLLLSGFPANDVEGHRRYHESVIEWRELRNKLVREALTKAAGATVMAGLGWVLMALWQAVVTTVNK